MAGFEVITEESEQWNALSFTERTLEFLVPSPKVRRAITGAALQFWLEYVKRLTLSKWGPPDDGSREIVQHIGNLLLVTAENRDTIADEIQTFLNEAIFSADKELAALGAGLALDLTHPLHTIQVRRQVSNEAVNLRTPGTRVKDGGNLDR
jgi:hypothetical protein